MNYPTIESTTIFAEQGDVFAQYHLGYIYSTGRGVILNYTKAVKWYTLAAMQGNADAQLRLGDMIAHGEGTIQNDAEAVNWYTLSADQCNAEAQNLLGNWYSNAQNTIKAMYWWRRAAEQGFSYAQYNFGRCYKLGTGMQKNITEAIKWFTLAAKQGHRLAILELRNK